MKSIACVVVILSTCVATDVDVFVYRGEDYVNKKVGKSEPRSSIRIGYETGDFLSIKIYLKNKPLNIHADVYLKYLTGINMEQDKLKTDYFEGERYYWIRIYLTQLRFTVDVELCTATDLCTTKNIVKGKDVTKSPVEKNDTLYHNICIRSQCVIEVDFLNINEWLYENIEKTNHNITAIGTNARTTRKTVIILSSLSAIALVLTVIIAIFKCCWMNRSSSVSSTLLRNEQSAPFYLNILFRRECDEEIAEIEQHYYEEIVP